MTNWWENGRWTVSCEPHGGDDDGGIVIYLTNGDRKEEVSRVRYARKNSMNKRTRFKAQLRDEIRKAELTATMMTDLANDESQTGAGRWRVILDPQGSNPAKSGKNESAVTVRITDGTDESTGTRVMFVRRNAIDKKIDFEKALSEEIRKAQESVADVNGLRAAADRARRSADLASQRLSRALGTAKANQPQTGVPF